MMTLEMVTENDGQWLIKLARNAILASIDKTVSLLDIQTSLSLSLYQKRGVFVSLWLNKQLRGCIGTPFPLYSLEEQVQENARKAFVDSRFKKIKKEELTDIEIEVTILTEPFPIEPEEIILGTHGLIVNQGFLTGLLLPSEPLTYGWTVETFLEHTCLKGNMPPHAWKEGADIYAFYIQTFLEDDES
jgi:uncharacterized protein